MKKISEHLGQIIIALAGVALLIAACVVFRGPIGEFYNGIVGKEASIAGSVLSGVEDPNLSDLSSGGSGIAHKGIIPAGATYTTNGTAYDSGNEFPAAVKEGDIYAFGDYKYTFLPSSNGWQVAINTAVTDKKQNTYGEILEYINDAPVTDMYYTFATCTSLAVAPEIPSTVTSMKATFRGCTSLAAAPSIPIGVIDMSGIFYGCSTLEIAPIIPDSVTNVSSAFDGCTLLRTYVGAPEEAEDGDFSGYKIPNSVVNLSATFSDCKALTHAPAIPSSVSNMTLTFDSCSYLTSPPDMSNAIGVTNMTSTFNGCSRLLSAPVIPNSVTNMSGTFTKCSKLSSAPLIPASVTNMSSTFASCTALTGTITINANPTTYTRCFSNTTQPIELTGESTMLDELAATCANGNVTVQ